MQQLLCIENSIRRAFTDYFEFFLKDISNCWNWEGTTANLSLIPARLGLFLELHWVSVLWFRLKINGSVKHYCTIHRLDPTTPLQFNLAVYIWLHLLWVWLLTEEKAMLIDNKAQKGQKMSKNAILSSARIASDNMLSSRIRSLNSWLVWRMEK